MVNQVPSEIKEEINLSFAISNKIDALMQERGLSKKQFADQIGKRPSKINPFTVPADALLWIRHRNRDKATGIPQPTRR